VPAACVRYAIPSTLHAAACMVPASTVNCESIATVSSAGALEGIELTSQPLKTAIPERRVGAGEASALARSHPSGLNHHEPAPEQVPCAKKVAPTKILFRCVWQLQRGASHAERSADESLLRARCSLLWAWWLPRISVLTISLCAHLFNRSVTAAHTPHSLNHHGDCRFRRTRRSDARAKRDSLT